MGRVTLKFRLKTGVLGFWCEVDRNGEWRKEARWGVSKSQSMSGVKSKVTVRMSGENLTGGLSM